MGYLPTHYSFRDNICPRQLQRSSDILRASLNATRRRNPEFIFPAENPANHSDADQSKAEAVTCIPQILLMLH
jgi:hypothetical protein